MEIREKTEILSGKIALVTGAGKGIGRSVAKKLAEDGASVVINYNSSSKAAEEAAAEIIQNGGTASVIKCNVSDSLDCKKMIDTVIAQYGRLDILVNNAGITRDGLLMKMSEQDFDEVIDTNLKGAFYTIRHTLRQFLKQKCGTIINISSVSGVMGNAGQANYSASKAGLIGLTKSVAVEYASKGIRCNAVAPGYITTDMTEAMSDTAKEMILSQIPMRRAGTVEEVAELVAFLASDRSSYITGQVISIDGGMHR